MEGEKGSGSGKEGRGMTKVGRNGDTNELKGRVKGK